MNIEIGSRAKLIDCHTFFFAQLLRRFVREDRQRAAIGHRLVGTKQGELVFVIYLRSEVLYQSRLIDRESFPVWRFDIDHQFGYISRNRIQVRRQFCRLLQVDRPRRLLRIAEPRAVTHDLPLIASGEKREPFRIGCAFKSKKSIAIHACVTGKHFVHLLTAHTFHWITPKAFDLSNEAHRTNKKEKRELRKQNEIGLTENGMS